MATTTSDTVAILPSLGMGHLIPAVEFANLIIPHNLSVVIILIPSPFPTSTSSSSVDAFVSSVNSSHPLITFHRLENPPPLPSPPPSSPIARMFDHYRRLNPLLSSFLQSQRASIRALVLDMFCTDALDVAADLSIPSYFFFSSSAFCLSTFLTLPKLQLHTPSFDDLGDSPVHIPGLPPVPGSHMPDHLRNREEEDTKVLVAQFKRLPSAEGILVNTFEMLEPRAVEALAAGVCACPVYCIGPLIAERKEEEEKHECLRWLDGQPKQSVVFLCWGSMGALSAEQVREIALGLERSEQRFLWVVRSPPSDDPKKRYEARPEPDLDVLMPEGFMERSRGIGMVVKCWAPQTAVLKHEAVGAFVTHCGWNSILEAVTHGVPMIAWPLYAEQKLNKVFLTEEAKLAVEMKGYDKGMVSAEEVETKLRWLMESEQGKELKDRAARMKEYADAARQDGGPSDNKWREFVTALK